MVTAVTETCRCNSLCQISHASLIKPYGKESSVGSHIFNISQEYYKKLHNLRISITKPHFRTLQKAVTVSSPSENFARPPCCFYSEVVNCMAFGVLQGHNSNKISLELVIRFRSWSAGQAETLTEIQTKGTVISKTTHFSFQQKIKLTKLPSN
jgi:hypothetical protein